MPARRFEHGPVGVRVERLGRRVHAQGFRVAFRETVRGLEAFGFRADLRERGSLQGIELADRRVGRVLRVEDGLRRRGDAVELGLERGDTGRGPADASSHGAELRGVAQCPVVDVTASVERRVFSHRTRIL